MSSPLTPLQQDVKDQILAELYADVLTLKDEVHGLARTLDTAKDGIAVKIGESLVVLKQIDDAREAHLSAVQASISKRLTEDYNRISIRLNEAAVQAVEKGAQTKVRELCSALDSSIDNVNSQATKFSAASAEAQRRIKAASEEINRNQLRDTLITFLVAFSAVLIFFIILKITGLLNQNVNPEIMADVQFAEAFKALPQADQAQILRLMRKQQ